MVTKKFNLPSVALLAAISLFAACGGEFGSSAPSASTTYTKIDIALPQGVSLKPDRKIASDNPALNAAIVTGISLEVNAPDMEPIYANIPLDTLEVILDIPSGSTRTFTVTVTTDTGDAFIGFQTVDLYPGEAIDLFIDVNVGTQNLTLAIGTWEMTDASGTSTLEITSSTIVHTDSDGCVESGVYTPLSSNTIEVTITSESSQCIAPATGYTLNVPFVMTVSVTSTTLTLNGGPANNETYTRVSTVTIPAAPTGVTATLGDGQVTISWNAVTGADTYRINWSTSSGVTNSSGTVISNITTNSYIHTGLANGTTYYYVVTAQNTAGDSSSSSETSATPVVALTVPAAPTGVTVTAGNEENTISWTAVSGANSYNIYYGFSSGITTSDSSITGITGTSHVHTGPLTAGTIIYYIVAAVNTAGESATSTEVSATPYKVFAGWVTGKTLSLAGTVTTYAGNAGATGSADGTGAAAFFDVLESITSDGTNLFVTDSYNHTIRKIVIATGAVTTIAGSAGVSGAADGTGNAARFNIPLGITTDGTNLYVADYTNNTIRQIVISTGVVTTLAGSGSIGGADGTGPGATFNGPISITTDGTNLYVSDLNNYVIRQIVISSKVVTTLAGTCCTPGYTDAQGSSAAFDNPRGLITDGTNLYLADENNHVIRKIVISTQVVTTLAGTGTPGTADGTLVASNFNFPVGITMDDSYIYVSERGTHRIRKIDVSGALVSVFVGGTTFGTADGTGTAAKFNKPYGIATDGISLYVADTINYTVRKVD